MYMMELQCEDCKLQCEGYNEDYNVREGATLWKLQITMWKLERKLPWESYNKESHK